ncbi:hypothetical protein V497_05053 [Pseudogymnoascus sp. VKM F-4516 (FW-969)]|nr:hypothetical protein V497_05053 [Pseudogymnoascus sp. VKM F-4516 (FW-969)]
MGTYSYIVAHGRPAGTASDTQCQVLNLLTVGLTVGTGLQESAAMQLEFKHYKVYFGIEGPDLDDRDRSFESEYLSLTTEANEYVFENGRRYHGYKPGRYMLPNDENEMDREDMKHHISMLITKGRLHLAPITPDPEVILDIGTGTGIWAIDAADLYPNAKVIATDLRVPPNLSFEIDDAEEDWLYEPQSIDLVHARVLKPGGYIELVEMHVIPTSPDHTLPPNSQIMELYTTLADASEEVGLDLAVARKYGSMMMSAGFENVVEEVFDLPIGDWMSDRRMKEVGAFQRFQMVEGLHGIAFGALTRVAGWTPTRVQVFLAGVRREMKDRGVHCMYTLDADILYGSRLQRTESHLFGNVASLAPEWRSLKAKDRYKPFACFGTKPYIPLSLIYRSSKAIESLWAYIFERDTRTFDSDWESTDLLLAQEGSGHAPAYGTSVLDSELERLFNEIFETEVAVFFVATGTAANCLALTLESKPGGVVFAHREAHIIADECGAPEYLSGQLRIQTVDGADGKMDPKLLRRIVERSAENDVRRGRPSTISVTQATEAGTVYSLAEIDAIAAVAKEFDLPLHMDGARFANALVSLGCTPAEMTWKRGVDMLSFGATKNGCWCAEAVILFDPKKAPAFPFVRKRAAQNFSKSRFISAQFEAYFRDGLWLDLARQANAMAMEISNTFAGLPSARLLSRPQSNEVFVVLKKKVISKIRAKGVEFYDWPAPSDLRMTDDELLCRFVTSFATTGEEVSRFSDMVKRASSDSDFIYSNI